jgi:hypothetical protein
MVFPFRSYDEIFQIVEQFVFSISLPFSVNPLM